MSAETDWRPADLGERIQTIDILRGMALIGVLIVNILSGFRVPLLEHIHGHYAGLGGLDYFVALLVSRTMEFKALTAFSFLFGAGIAIQTERGMNRNASPRDFLVRRLAWLFVLGAG